MNKLLRQFSSDEFEALISQMKSGNIFQDLTGPVDVSSLSSETSTLNSDLLTKNFDLILDSMVGTNIILTEALTNRAIKLKKETPEVYKAIGISSVKTEARRKFDDMRQYITSIKSEVKRIVQESNSEKSSILPSISGSSVGTASGIAIAGAGIAAAGVGISQYENFGIGVPSKSALGEDVVTNADSAIQFFVNKGWTREQAAGIVGNLMVESGNFDPKVISGERRGDGGRAVGIAQWHPDRQATFKRIMGKSVVGSTVQEQLAFVDWELKHTEKAAGDKLRQAKTATEAAIIVDQKYERSSGEARAQRIQRANQIVQQNTINSTTGKGKPTGPMADVLNTIAPNASRINSGFGQRKDPFSGRRSNHGGIDINGKLNDPVKSIGEGIVEFSGVQNGYGNTVIVRHPDGKKTLYAHLNILSVNKGQTVSRGQTIGGMGTTGTRSTGVHLHFEVRDSKNNKLNPLDIAPSMIPKPPKPKVMVQPIVVPGKPKRGYVAGSSSPAAVNRPKKEGRANKGPTFSNFYNR